MTQFNLEDRVRQAAYRSRVDWRASKTAKWWAVPATRRDRCAARHALGVSENCSHHRRALLTINHSKHYINNKTMSQSRSKSLAYVYIIS